MAEITSDMVKQLRDATQAGMMDCKKALVETNGDFELAKDYLRKKGILKADKVSGRETGEGIIYSYIHHNNKLGVLLELTASQISSREPTNSKNSPTKSRCSWQQWEHGLSPEI
jgi:translation elongation factor EF-Ts